MRKLIFLFLLLLLAAVSIFLIATNPSEKDFVRHLRESDVIPSAPDDGVLGQIKNRVLKEVLAQEAKATVARKNYLLFSVFEYSSLVAGQDRMVYLGIADRYVRLGSASEKS